MSYLIIEVATDGKETIIFEDTEAKSCYNALVRYRKDNPDGKYLEIEKKRYGRRKRWTLTLGGKEYVAEEHFSVYDTMARHEDRKDWFIDETFNSRNMNDGW